MAGRIAGITIEIGGDTTKLQKALSGTDSSIKKTQDALKDVNKLLKMDPGNTELLKQKYRDLGSAIDDTKSRLQQLKDAEKQVSQNKGNYSAWKKAYEPIQKEIDKTSDKTKKLKEQLKKLEEGGKVDTDEYRKLQAELADTEEKAKQLRKEAKAVSDEFGNPISPEQFDALQREIIETEQKLKSLNGEMKDFGSVGAQKFAAVGAKMETVGGKISAVGEKLSAAGTKLLPVTGAIVGAGAAAVKTAANFEDGMAGVQATLGITSDATTELDGKTVNVMESLEGLARQMGAETKFSATEAAGAINILAMAGYDVKQIYSGLPQLLSLAAAGDLEIASAADITTGILAGFNMETEESGDVVDKLAKLASSAKGDVSSFGAGLSAVAGQATSTGQNFDDVATALGILGNNNISASEGGTMLQRVLKNLYQPTDVAKEKLDELGIAAYNADGSARALPDVLEQLQGKLSSLNDEEKNQVLNKIFDTAAIRGATALIREAGGGFDELKGKISDSAGAAQQMADVRMDTLSGQLQLLKSATEEAGIAFGQSLVPLVKDAVGVVQKAVDWVNKLTDAQKKTILKVAAVTAAVGPALLLGGKVFSAVGKVTQGVGKAMQLAPKIVSGVKTVGTAILGLNPVVLATVGAVAAVTAAVVGLRAAQKGRAGELYGLTEAQKEENAALAENAQAVRDAEAARQETMGGISEEYGYYQSLADELRNITDANGKVKEGYEDRAAVITGLLSDALGIEIEVTDGVIGKYDELMGKIDQVIEKKQAEAMIMADQEAYSNAIKTVGDAETAYIDKVNEQAEAYANLQKAEQEYADFKARYSGMDMTNPFDALESAELKANVDAAKTAYEEASQAVKNTADTYVTAVTTIQNHEALLEASISGKGLTEAIQNVQTGFKTAANATKEQLEEQYRSFQEHYDKLKEAVANGATNVSDETLRLWEDMAHRAALELHKGGQEGGEQYDAGVAQGIDDNKDQVHTSAEGVRDQVNIDLSAEGEKTGASYDEGLIRGMLSLSDKVAATANHLAGLIPNGTNMTLQVKSPSRVAKRIGKYWDQGLIAGMKEQMPDVAAMSRSVAGSMITDASAMVRYPEISAGAYTQTVSVVGAGGTDPAALRELQGLRRDMAQLSERMGRMQVRMDTGALVGTLADPMDTALGRKVAIRGRR